MRGFGEIAERLRRSTVEVFAERRRGGGSGVVWRSDGLILTNAHVARQRQLKVQLWDGTRLEAKVISQDPRRDLAALRITGGKLDADLAAAPGDSEALRPGQLVIAVGSPLGFSGALSTGVVHSLGPVAGMGSQPWIRADVQLAPGNSGGPLAGAGGEVVGINTAVMNGLGLAVPSKAVAAFLERGARPSLGVTLQPVSFGLVLVDVDPEGAAAAASLRPGDILLGSFETLNEALDSGREVIRLPFFRGDRSKLRETYVRLAPAEAVAA